MSVMCINSTEMRIRNNILNTLKGLRALPKVSVYSDDKDINTIFIKHEQEYVPDFELVWCDFKKHYRAYILTANTQEGKKRAGYCIFVISSQLVAMGFGVLYNFIHKNRANNKSSASLATA